MREDARSPRETAASRMGSRQCCSGAAASGANRIPVGLKIAFSAFVAVWASIYWWKLGACNFLWFCNLANFVLIVALWREDRLLFSSQAVSILVAESLWVIDLLVRAVSGFHPFGATAYMFDASQSELVRVISLFHAAVPFLLVWGLWRLGYDRKALPLQTGIAWIILPLCYFVTAPEQNINWVWGLSYKAQSTVDPRLYLAALMVAVPVVFYLPTHLVLERLFGRGE